MENRKKINNALRKIRIRVYQDLVDYKLPILLFVAYFIIVIKIFHAFCPSVILTGFPCPACGMTRAVVCLASGEFRQSVELNPMAIPWIGTGIWFAIQRYILGKKVTGIYLIMGILCAVMIGIHIYRMLYLFPGEIPLTYKKDNLLSYIFRIGKELLQ